MKKLAGFLAAVTFFAATSAALADAACQKCTHDMQVQYRKCLCTKPISEPVRMRMLFPGRASAVREVGALSDLDNITVRIADVAAYLAVLGDRLRDELGSSTFP